MKPHKILPAILSLLVLPARLPAEPPAVDWQSAVARLEARIERLETLLARLTPAAVDTPAAVADPVQEIREEVRELRRQMAAGSAPTALPTAAAASRSPVGSKFSTQIYGYLKLDAVYDTHKTSVGDVAFYVKPVAAGGEDNEFNMTARESRLGFKLDAPVVDGWKTQGVLELDFYGGGSANTPLPRIRLAYLDFGPQDGGWSLRAGQDWETFQTFLPRSLDFGFLADQGALGLRRPQLRYTQRREALGGTWETRLALVRTIGQDLDGGGQEDGVDSGLPSLQWNFLYERKGWAERDLRLSFSGHLGSDEAEYGQQGEHESYASWSLIGSFFVPLHSQWSLQGTVWTGSNLDTYLGGIGQGINVALRRVIDAYGGYLQVLWDPSARWQGMATLGLDDPNDGDLSPGMRNRNFHASVGTFYWITPHLKYGVQVTRLATGYKDSGDAVDWRFHQGLFFLF